MIKKRRSWPKNVDGGGIDKRFEGHAVGTVKSLPGQLDGVAFKIFAMKEEDYTMKLMSTYGATIKIDNGTTQRSITENGAKVAKTFKYTEPGVGKYLPWPSILVFLVCGQLTGIQEPSKTVIWYIPPTRVRFLRTRVRLR